MGGGQQARCLLARQSTILESALSERRSFIASTDIFSKINCVQLNRFQTRCYRYGAALSNYRCLALPEKFSSPAFSVTRLASSSASSPKPEKFKEADEAKHYVDTVNATAFLDRHSGIVMHPDSISKEILPGNFIRKQQSQQNRYTELVHGYFWMVKDLRRTNSKPILSNSSLISEGICKPFPALHGLTTLAGEKVDIPDFFCRKNRSGDPKAQCTLVAISFRDYGYQLLKSWIGPFEEAMKGKDRVEVIQLNLSEGWFNKWVLGVLIHSSMKRNTPVECHDRTLLYFGSNLLDFRDCLRMHNVMTGYVFLLDGLGRVRYAGSGEASEEEMKQLIQFARELTPLLKRPQARAQRPAKAGKSSVGKRSLTRKSH